MTWRYIGKPTPECFQCHVLPITSTVLKDFPQERRRKTIQRENNDGAIRELFEKMKTLLSCGSFGLRARLSLNLYLGLLFIFRSCFMFLALFTEAIFYRYPKSTLNNKYTSQRWSPDKDPSSGRGKPRPWPVRRRAKRGDSTNRRWPKIRSVRPQEEKITYKQINIIRKDGRWLNIDIVYRNNQ